MSDTLNIVVLRINIFEQILIDDIDETLSNTEKINVQYMDDRNEYHINYMENDFTDVDIDKLIKFIEYGFSTNLPNKKVYTTIRYIFGFPIDDNKIKPAEFDKLHEKLSNLENSIIVFDKSSVLEYIPPSYDDDELTEKIMEEYVGDYEYDEDDDDDEEDYDIEDYDIDSASDAINEMFGNFGTDLNIDIDDHYSYTKGNKKYRNSRRKYSVSKVFSRSDDIKKNISKNNGLIISSRKNINKDKELLEKFLKVYFPGNKKWIKDFRKMILTRWIMAYSITNKQAKELRRKQKKKYMAKLAKPKTSLIGRSQRETSSFYDISK